MLVCKVPRGESTSIVQSMQGKSRSRVKKVHFNSRFGVDDAIEDSAALSFMAVRFLGRLGGSAQAILDAGSYNSSSSPRHCHWDQETLDIRISLQCFQDSGSRKLNFQVGSIIPLILHLCTQTADRSIRVLAAESLHALILYMIGQSATSPQRNRASLYSKCYATVFPVVISLSSSIDPICRKLFGELLTQIAHWFSGNKEVHEEDVEALLTALTKGLCDESDAMVRESCASTLKEFFHWAVKQASSKELKSDHSTIDRLLERLIALSQNPSERKRLGAALVFGKIYRTFREEAELIRRYVLLITRRLHDGHRMGGNSQQELAYAMQQYLTIIFKSVRNKGDQGKLLLGTSSRHSGNQTMIS